MTMRLAGEPGRPPYFFAALTGAQNVGPSLDDGSHGVVYAIRATNNGAVYVGLTASAGGTQFDSLRIPPGETRELTYGSSGSRYYGQLSVTTDGAVDVTAILL